MRTLAIGLLLVGGCLAPCVAQHRIPCGTTSNGGAVIAGGAFRATVIVGQPTTAQVGHGAYTVRSGFLLTLAALTPTGVAPQAEGGPVEFGLGQNFPNPFNPSTTIPFSLKTRSVVTLRLFDSLGREVTTLALGSLDAGRHTVTFDAGTLPSGVYFYRLEAGPFSALRKATLLK